MGLSLYFGTVLHSLDHQNVFDIVGNPFWLRKSDTQWSYLEEFCRVVRVGFLGDHTSVFPTLFKSVPESDCGGFFPACLQGCPWYRHETCRPNGNVYHPLNS